MNKLTFKLRLKLSRYSWFEKYVISEKIKRGDFKDDNFQSYIDNADDVLLDMSNWKKKPTVALFKDIDNYGNYVQKRSYWDKYERFLKRNNIPYKFVNLSYSNWEKEISNCDIIIWKTDNGPHSQHDAEGKIYYIEKYLNKSCFPSFNEVWSYEDKIRSNYLLDHFNIPHIKTFITQNKKEALDYINTTSYPIVSKIYCGSASRGVILLDSKSKANNFIKKVFAEGKSTIWPFHGQKDYVYFQEFIEDATYDLRIIIVGNKAFGYYRMRPNNDFRASGAGIYKKENLPIEAMKIAVHTKKAFNSTILAVDFVYSENRKQFLIIETSIFFGVDTPEQLVVNGEVGYYEITENDSFIFKKGRLWMQELSLYETLTKWHSTKQ